MSELYVEIVTPEELSFADKVHMITMPGTSGDFGVLFGHVPLISSINPGLVIIHDQDMKIVEKFFVSYGFAEVTNTSVNLLVEKSVRISDLDPEAFKEDLKVLKETLKNTDKEEDVEVINKNIIFTEGALSAFIDSL